MTGLREHHIVIIPRGQDTVNSGNVAERVMAVLRAHGKSNACIALPGRASAAILGTHCVQTDGWWVGETFEGGWASDKVNQTPGGGP
jgi:hypothetical protein